MVRNYLLVIVLAVLVVVTTSTRAQAGVIYSDLGPGDSFQTGVGWTIDPISPLGPGTVRQEVAMSFIVPAGFDYIFTSLDIALNRFGLVGLGSLDLLLTNDSAGIPGTVIETLSVTNPPDGLFNVVSVSTPTLTAGTTYWIATQSLDYVGAWNYNNTSAIGLATFSHDNGSSWNSPTTETLGAFRINGNQVPEPSSVVLFCAGSVAVLVHGWCRRRVRDKGDRSN